MKDAQKRFWQTLRLVEKEGEYLQDVAGRLFVVPEIKAEWIERLIASPEGRNRLVHEYVEDRAELAAALTQARAMTDELLNACRVLRSSAEAKFAHAPAGNSP